MSTRARKEATRSGSPSTTQSATGRRRYSISTRSDAVALDLGLPAARPGAGDPPAPARVGGPERHGARHCVGRGPEHDLEELGHPVVRHVAAERVGRRRDGFERPRCVPRSPAPGVEPPLPPSPALPTRSSTAPSAPPPPARRRGTWWPGAANPPGRRRSGGSPRRATGRPGCPPARSRPRSAAPGRRGGPGRGRSTRACWARSRRARPHLVVRRCRRSARSASRIASTAQARRFAAVPRPSGEVIRTLPPGRGGFSPHCKRDS